MKVRIFQQTKTATQSGRAGIGDWILEYEAETARRAEPLMGWIGSGDTLNQVRLRFANRDDAVAFAVRKGWEADIAEPHVRRVIPRNYADNFRADRPRIGRF